ncbi:peroxide-responsive transcriptional repressor PerR [Desmospora profundinema]|uniref:Fur family peroxide stress response transcriptional regulator n=1 Tax=Desmospora profundinema TaxID=1571184 RepID=A0ABU1IV53_9BACL|nr:peroxide-responsive transcriptional repressor PerR [Desmospora profundinema]MDR6227620.1 Fur family peroxide stress response transcriptional regulator [Desmospora profundinema]
MENNRLNRAVEQLKSTGVRMTPQRYAILEYLLTSLGHPTADDIYKALEGRFPNMSVATVYNNLRVFKEAGLVRELTYGDSSSRFDANMHEHYHIICRECGKIVDFEYPSLIKVEEEAAKVTGFQVENHRMEIYGRCRSCQEQESKEPLANRS